MSIICTVLSTLSAIASAIAASKSYKIEKANREEQDKREQNKRNEFENNVNNLYCRVEKLSTDLKLSSDFKSSLENLNLCTDYRNIEEIIKIIYFGPTHSAANYKEADLLFTIQNQLPRLIYQQNNFFKENKKELNLWCENTLDKIKNNFDFIK